MSDGNQQGRRGAPHWVFGALIALLANAAPLAAVDVQDSATQIDALVSADLARNHLHANREINDDVFMRRIYLDVIGRIPTYDEVQKFRADTSDERRNHLIDALMESPGYVSAQYNYWADLLRLQTYMMGRYSGQPYIDWVKKAIQADMPYDQFVAALIDAKGPVLAEGNGQTGYYLRDAGMPQDNMSNTVQVFLGTHLACAQCHNHPFDKWTRIQYLQMVAYTNSTRTEADPQLVAALKKFADQQGGPSKDEKQAMRTFTDTISGRVADNNRATISLPKDFQYPDGKPGQLVSAHPIFGDITLAKGDDPRQSYAQWLTSPDNPRFTEVIANRLWKRVMGLGVIEPVDNLTDLTQASNPELMTYLTNLMKDCDYDLKKYQDILYHTQAYQHASTLTTVSAAEPYHFPGPVLRRMSAEQVWDSLMGLIVPDLDERHLSDAAALYAYYQGMSQKTPAEIWDLVQQIAEKTKERRDISDQMRQMDDMSPDRDAMHKAPEYLELKKQGQSLDSAIQDLSFDRVRNAQAPETNPIWKGIRRDFVRASELPSPAPNGHFLRDFGSSDRNLIDNSNRIAAVTQALTLLNGFVDQNLLQPKTVLMRQVALEPDAESKVEIIFISLLGRNPTADDLAVFSPWMEQPASEQSAPVDAVTAVAKPGTPPPATPAARTDALVRAVVWTLTNSREFLFVQ